MARPSKRPPAPAPTRAPTPAAAEGAPVRPITRLLLGVFAATTIGVSAGACWIARPTAPATATPATGALMLSSHPDGATVRIDGADRGTTPLVLTLPAGDHAVRLQLDGAAPLEFVASITAGADWRRHVALTPETLAPVPATLLIETERAGAAVFVDGIGVGATPLTLTTLAPGPHVVNVRGAAAMTTRRVVLSAGTTTSLVLGGERPPATTSGWLSVPSPVELQIVEDGRLLGVSRSERIMVPAGRHVLELVNESLGVRQRASVVVEPDSTATVRVELPSAPVNINAQPWATVLIDDRSYGDTPIANVPVRVGEHTVTLRHPTLGEHTVRVTVRQGSPNRVTVDLRR